MSTRDASVDDEDYYNDFPEDAPLDGTPLATQVMPLPDPDESRWTKNYTGHWRDSGPKIFDIPVLGSIPKTLNNVCMSLMMIPQLVTFFHFLCSGLGIASLLICIHYDIKAKLHWGKVSIALMFPMGFAINKGMHHREAAMVQFAQVRACLLALWFLARNCTRVKMEAANKDHSKEMMRLRSELYALIDIQTHYLKQPNAEHLEWLEAVYSQYGRLGDFIDTLRPYLEASVMSRTQQMMYHSMQGFEKMRVFKEYGTPYTLRALLYISILSFPILFGPYYAWLNDAYTIGVPLTIVVSIFTVFTFCSLLSVAESFEHIYSQSGRGQITGNGTYISVRLPMKQLKAAMKLVSEEPYAIPASGLPKPKNDEKK